MAKRGGLTRLRRRLLELTRLPVVLLCLLPALALRLAGYRILFLSTPGRFGHVAAEIDWYLKSVALGDFPHAHALVPVDPDRVANRHLLSLWAPHVRLVTHPLARRVLGAFRRLRFVAIPLGPSVIGNFRAARMHALSARWGARPPILELDAETRDTGNATLRRLGVPEGAWYVGLHCRESGYSPDDEHIHGYRNARIDAFLDAVRLITGRGGWVIRLGDPSMTPLPPLPQVIDYAIGPEKSEAMDCFLCANARFVLCTSSGLQYVAIAFGTPVAVVNQIPLSVIYPPAVDALAIAKRVEDRSGQAVPFADQLAWPMEGYRDGAAFADAGLRLVDNTPGEIAALAGEMLDRLDGTHTASPGDEALQARFRALIGPDHYCHGAPSRIGRSWLAGNAHLLPAGTCAEPPAGAQWRERERRR